MRGASIPIDAVVHHGIDVDEFPVGKGGGGCLAVLGRMTPDKGIDRAIDVARKADMSLRIAAKMREPHERAYFKKVIEPLLGGDVEYLGELDAHEKLELLSEAQALLNPINWEEPFGMSMIESMACGTPVLGTPHGAAPELVDDGVTGYPAGVERGVGGGGAAPRQDRPGGVPAAGARPLQHRADGRRLPRSLRDQAPRHRAVMSQRSAAFEGQRAGAPSRARVPIGGPWRRWVRRIGRPLIVVCLDAMFSSMASCSPPCR